MFETNIKKHGFYVYLHKSKLDDHVFYVGKGKRERAWSFYNRSKFWRSCVDKHGLKVEIVEYALQEWAAFEIEESLISLYGRKDLGYGRLCNHTDGNDGNLNPNQSTREKISIAQKRRIVSGDHHFMSDVGKAKQRESIIGDKNPSKRQDVRKLISKTKIGLLNPMYGKRGAEHSRSRPVICVDNGQEFDSATFAGEWVKSVKLLKTERAHTKIASVCRGERFSAYGMKWKYKQALEIT